LKFCLNVFHTNTLKFQKWWIVFVFGHTEAILIRDYLFLKREGSWGRTGRSSRQKDMKKYTVRLKKSAR